MLITSMIWCMNAANAASFLLNFTAGPFTPGTGPATISGSFNYTAASATSPITSVDSVSVTTQATTYTLAAIGSSSAGNISTIGALSGGGVDTIPGGSVDDFRLTWDHTTGTPSDFRYSTAATSPLYTLSGSFSNFTITPAAVPEPGTAALVLILGAGTLVGRRLRRKSEQDIVSETA